MVYDPKDGILSDGETVKPKVSVKGDKTGFIKFNLSDVDFGKIHDAKKENPGVTLTSRFEVYTAQNPFPPPKVKTAGQSVFTTELDEKGKIISTNVDQFPAGNTLHGIDSSFSDFINRDLGTSADTTTSKSSELHQMLVDPNDTTNATTKSLKNTIKKLIKAKNKFTDYKDSPFLATSDEPTLFEGGSWPDFGANFDHAFEAASLALVNVPFTLGSNQGYYKSHTEAPEGAIDITLKGNTNIAKIRTAGNTFTIPEVSTSGQSVFTTHLGDEGKIISDDPDQFPAINTLKANTKSKIFAGDSPIFPALELGKHSSTDKGHKLLSNIDPANTTGKIKTDVQQFLKSANRFIPGTFSPTGMNSPYIKDFLDPVNSFKLWTDLAKNNPFDTHDQKKFTFDPGYSYADGDLGKYFKNPQYDDKPTGLLSVTYEGLQKLKENEFHVSLNQPAAYTPPQPGVDGVVSHEVFASKKDIEFTGISNSILEGTATGQDKVTKVFSKKTLGARTTSPETKQKLHELLLGNQDTNDQLAELGTALEELTTNKTRWPIKSLVADTKPGFVQPEGFKVQSGKSLAWPDLGNLVTEPNTKITLQPGTYGPNKSQGYYKSEAAAKADTNPDVKTVDYITLKGLAALETADSVYGFGEDDSSFTSEHNFVDSFIEGNQPFDHGAIKCETFDPVESGILPHFEFGVSTEVKYKKDDPLLKTAHTLLSSVEGNDSGLQASEINNVVLQPINRLLKNTRRWDGMAPTGGSDTERFLPAEQIPALFKGGNWLEFGDPTTVPVFESKEIAVHNMDLGKYGQSTDDVTNGNAESVTLYSNRSLGTTALQDNMHGPGFASDDDAAAQFSETLVSDLIGNEAGGPLNKYSLERAMGVSEGNTFGIESEPPYLKGKSEKNETTNTLLSDDDLYDTLKNKNIPLDVTKFISQKHKFSPGNTSNGVRYQEFIEEDKIWPNKKKSAFTDGGQLNEKDQHTYNKHGVITEKDEINQTGFATEGGTLTRLGKYYKNGDIAINDTNPNAKDVSLRRMKKLGSLRTQNNTLASTKPGDTGTEGISKDGSKLEFTSTPEKPTRVYVDKDTMGKYFRPSQVGATKFAPEYMPTHTKKASVGHRIDGAGDYGFGTTHTSTQKSAAKKRQRFLLDFKPADGAVTGFGPGNSYYNDEAYTKDHEESEPLPFLISQVLKSNRFNPGTTSPYLEKGTSAEDFHSKTIAGMPKEVSGFGTYSKGNTAVTLEDLSKVGFSLLMKATGESQSIWSEDPHSAQTQAGALLLPSLTQLGLTKMDPTEMYAENAFKAPRTKSDGLGIDLTAQNWDPDADSTRPYKLHGSVGSLNNPIMIFDGFLPVGMVILASLLALAASALVQLFSVILRWFTSGSDKKGRVPLFRAAKQISPGGTAHPDRRPLGMYFDTRLGASVTDNDPASSLGASGFFSLSDIGIVMVENDYDLSTKKGVEILFGIADTAGGGGGSFVNIIRAPGYYGTLCRAWVMSGNQLAGDLRDLVKSFSTNPAAGVQSMLNLTDKLKSSKLIGMLNVCAQIGNQSINAKASDLIDPASGRLRHHNDSHTMKIVGTTRVRFGGMGTLGAGSAPSAYLMPKSVLGGHKLYTDSTAGTAATGLTPLLAYTKLNANYKAQNQWVGAAETRTAATDLGAPGGTAKSKLSNDTVKSMEDQLEAEYMPFYFHDLRTNEIIGFQAFLVNLQDQYAVKHQQTDAYGRGDPVMVYQGTTRSISVEFMVVAVDKTDFDEMWWKINKLVTLVYPQYDGGRFVTSPDGSEKFVQPLSQIPSASPVIRLRLGDIFKSNYTKFALTRLFGNGQDGFKIQGTTQMNANITAATTTAAAETKSGFDRHATITANSTAYFAADGKPAVGDQIFYLAKKSSGDINNRGVMSGPVAEAVGIDARKLRRKIRSDTLQIKGKVTTAPAAASGETPETSIEIELDKAHLTELGIHKFVTGKTTYKYSPMSGEVILNAAVELAKIKADEAKAYADELSALGEDATKINAGFGDFFKPENNIIVKSFQDASPGRGLAGVIKSLSFNWLDNYAWNIGDESNSWDKGGDGEDVKINNRAPMMCKVSISYQPIHDIAPGLSSDGFNRAPVYNVGAITAGMTNNEDRWDGHDKGNAVLNNIRAGSGIPAPDATPD